MRGTSTAPRIRPVSGSSATAAVPRSVTVPTGLLIYAIPALVAVVLSLPCLAFTFQWDDYDFLTNALLRKTGDLLPDPADPFYRPISRGVYFLVLNAFGDQGVLVGHLLNLAFLAGVVLLLVRLAWRLAGPTAAVLAGLVFAGLGSVPTLIGWICCDQDLLSMLFILAALHAQLFQKRGLALLWTAAALLSKETALAVIPALVLLDAVLGRKPARTARTMAAYGALVLAWGLMHPAVRILVSRGLASGATGYVGLENPARWPVYFIQYALTMVNLRVTTPLPQWPVHLTVPLVGAVGLTWFILNQERRDPPVADREGEYSSARVLALAGLMCIGPLVLTSTIIRGWAPYYAAYSALGLTIAAGVVLARLPASVRIGTLAVFLTLGVWSRASNPDPETPTETNFRLWTQALERVSANFRKLHTKLPPGSQLLVSVQARGRGGVYTHIYAFDVVRVWYRDPTLRTRKPTERDARGGPEFLFVITPDWDVVEIDPASLSARSASGRDPDYAYCEGAVRAYASGLARSGEIDRAVGLLLHMPEISTRMRGVHHRLAATLLLAEAREAEADSLLSKEPPIERGYAIANLRAVLAEQPPGRPYDDFALRAFGIASTDADAMRELMRWFVSMRYAEVAIRFAERVEALSPGDPEAATARAKMQAILDKRKREPLWPGQLEL